MSFLSCVYGVVQSWLWNDSEMTLLKVYKPELAR